jgi:hypothetical protein
MAKYSRLLRIAEELGNSAVYGGKMRWWSSCPRRSAINVEALAAASAVLFWLGAWHKHLYIAYICAKAYRR